MKLTQVGSGLARVEVTGRGNTGLLRQGNNYGCKKFYGTGPHWLVLGNSSIRFDLNYLVINEMKQNE
jgi:hypothetical protein